MIFIGMDLLVDIGGKQEAIAELSFVSQGEKYNWFDSSCRNELDFSSPSLEF